jgi:hypothetical protein
MHSRSYTQFNISNYNTMLVIHVRWIRWRRQSNKRPERHWACAKRRWILIGSNRPRWWAFYVVYAGVDWWAMKSKKSSYIVVSVQNDTDGFFCKMADLWKAMRVRYLRNYTTCPAISTRLKGGTGFCDGIVYLIIRVSPPELDIKSV